MMVQVRKRGFRPLGGSGQGAEREKVLRGEGENSKLDPLLGTSKETIRPQGADKGEMGKPKQGGGGGGGGRRRR